MSFYRLETDERVGDWPKRTHYCRPSEIKETLRRAREEHLAAWRKHRGLMRFLQDHYPAEYEAVQSCRMGEPWVDGAMIGRHEARIKLSECRCVPFCPACNDAGTWRRVMGTLNKITACTPKGQEPLFIHAVQTAPVYENGKGWGMPASQDNSALRRLVWGVIEKAYGEGVGGSLTYHDFGERAFAKRAPHVDFTLNGWMLKNGKPTRTPDYDRPSEELQYWDSDIVKAARKKWPDVVVGRGNFFIRRPVEGVPSYIKALKYQLRELVDVKKIRYDATRQTVTWVRYNDRSAQVSMSVEQFQRGLNEYRQRLHPWGKNSGGRPLDGRYGHLSDRSRSETVRIMGGVEHDDECQCQRCRDWQRIPFEDEDQHDWSDVWNE